MNHYNEERYVLKIGDQYIHHLIHLTLNSKDASSFNSFEQAREHAIKLKKFLSRKYPGQSITIHMDVITHEIEQVPIEYV